MQNTKIKILISILFFIIVSLIQFNSYAAVQSVPEDAIVIATTDENGDFIRNAFTILEGGNYVIVGNEINRSIIYRNENQDLDPEKYEGPLTHEDETNPVRLYITGDLYVNTVGTNAPFIGLQESTRKCLEIIGVGNTPPTIYERGYSNIVFFLSGGTNTILKMENLVLDSLGGFNMVTTHKGAGYKKIELKDLTFQNWNSNNSGFALSLAGNSGGALDAKVENCKFINNGGIAGGGAAVTGYNASNKANVEFINCLFEGNYNTTGAYSINYMAASVSVRSNSVVTMKDCIITDGKGNYSTTEGYTVPGGITIASGSTCILDNTQITGNSECGVYNMGTLILKGNTNVVNNEGVNIYLPNNKYITFDENYTGKSGVTVQNPPDFNEQRRISDIEDSEYQQIYKNENIFSDNKDYTVRHDLANYLYLWKHAHIWEYVGADNVIDGICVADPDCAYRREPIKLILSAKNMVYTGNPYDKAEIENNITSVTGDSAGAIYYEGIGETVYAKTTTPPTETGTYRASVELGGALAIKDFEILFQKCNITVIKNWDDNNNSYNIRPTSIIVELLQNNVVIQEAEINDENGWQYVFEDVLVLDSDKNMYTYTVREKDMVEGYFVKEIIEDNNVFTIINSKAGTIKINKEDLLTGEKLPGAIFKIERKLSDYDWELVSREVADSNGSIIINNLIYGTYKITEVKAPNGYNLNLENREIELEINEENLNYEITVANKAKPNLPDAGAGRIQLVLLIIVLGMIIFKRKDKQRRN